MIYRHNSKRHISRSIHPTGRSRLFLFCSRLFSLEPKPRSVLMHCRVCCGHGMAVCAVVCFVFLTLLSSTHQRLARIVSRKRSPSSEPIATEGNSYEPILGKKWSTRMRGGRGHYKGSGRTPQLGRPPHHVGHYVIVVP